MPFAGEITLNESGTMMNNKPVSVVSVMAIHSFSGMTDRIDDTITLPSCLG
jgi:hypothetical protein